jgi:hypothetical protein
MDKVRSYRVDSISQERPCGTCGRVIALGGGGYRLESAHLPSMQVACSWQCVQDALHLDLEAPDDADHA